MKKYLDILIFTLLFFFLFSYFSWKQEGASAPSGVVFETSKNSYAVPAGISLNVTNNLNEKLEFNTCESIDLRYSGEAVIMPESFCADIVLNPRESKVLDLSGEYDLFNETGNYTFSFKYDDVELYSQAEVEYRWTIWKIFVGLFYAPIYNLLAFLIQFFSNSLWAAIIAITVVIRILLLFPQHKMMVSQRKMQAIQPKIKKLQEKHKWNQQMIWVELMKLYKQEWVNPMWSCGFLIIQMPILLVIYNIIMNITSLKNEFYLYNPLQDFQTSQIDFTFFGLDLLWSGWVAGICLAFSVAAIQYIQVKLSLVNKTNDESKKWVVLEKKKWEKDYNSMMPDPEMMNKFMLYGMPAMVWVFTFSLAAWIWLYWWISTTFAIFQQLFVNKIIKK